MHGNRDGRDPMESAGMKTKGWGLVEMETNVAGLLWDVKHMQK